MQERSDNPWAQKRYIALVRQSNDKDGASSTEAQLSFIARACAAVGMRHIDNVVGEGLSGSMPGKRSDLDELLQRKREKNDFDVIAVQVADRLTRGGGAHGLWFEHECKRHGIELYFAGDDVPNGPYSAMIRVAKYEAAHEVAVDIGRRSAQGQAYAQQAGFFRTTGQTPIGCDRLYLGADDRPRYIIHNLPDGRQQQLDPQTRQVMGEYGTQGSRSRNRFKKQRNEYSLLIPGDRQQVRAVRVIFYLRYKKGWRGQRIADLLNRQGIPSPRGRSWSQRQVESVYENEAYTGFLYAGQSYSGRFVRRDRERGYVPLNRDECAMATATHFQPVYLPFQQWQKIEQPHLQDFLPKEVRALAMQAQQEMWQRRLDPARPKLPRNRYPTSAYLLSNRLIAKQDGEALVGTLSGNKGKQVSYYRHKRAKRVRQRGSVYNNLIPAEPLHAAILELLTDLLQQMPEFRSNLEAMVKEQRLKLNDESQSLTELAAERDELNQRIRLFAMTLTGAALHDATPELARMGERRNAIEAEIQARIQSQSAAQEPVEQVVDRVIKRLSDLAESVQSLPTEALWRVVQQLIPKAYVDMETKAVEFEIAVPDWAVAGTAESMCPDSSLRSSTSWWTHAILTAVICTYGHKRGSHQPVCYQCRRRRAA